MTRKGIDSTDARIIKILQKNGRKPYTEIAVELNLAESTIRSRVQKLIDNKIIQIVAVGDPLKLGFTIAGNIKLRIQRDKLNRVLDELELIDEIWYIAIATGGVDIDMEFHAKSITELKNLLLNKLSSIKGIIGTETSIVIEFRKRDYRWGTGLD